MAHNLPVCDADSYDGLPDLDRVLHDECQIVSTIHSAAHIESASMDPDSYWKTGVLIARGTNDIEIETVFRLLVADLVTSVANALLEAVVSIGFTSQLCQMRIHSQKRSLSLEALRSKCCSMKQDW